MKTSPLENYSSLHELSLTDLLGWNNSWLRKGFFVQFDFNLHTPLNIHPQAYLTVHTQDAHSPPRASDCCLSIINFTRWRLDISSYRSIDDYLAGSIRWHRCSYAKSKKNFLNYGCKISVIEGDWSEHVERVYRLYTKVAHRYKHWLYDLHFFQEIAKRPDYKLLCAWFEGEMIGVFVLQEEGPTLHSTCCGFDYQHSSASYAYTWMHYAFFDHAIAAQKYQNVDAGPSADEAKKSIGFKPILSRMDIYSKGRMTRGLLALIARFFRATITPEAKLKLEWRYTSRRQI